MDSYDQIISRIIDLSQASDENLWSQAALFFYAREVMGVKAGQIASDAGYSAVYVRELSKAHQVFLDEDSRPYKEAITFSHYRMCAKTDDPCGWIARAAENGWSVRELIKALAGGRVPADLREASRVLAKVESILDGEGEAAAWLWNELCNLLDRIPSEESGRLEGVFGP